MDNFSLNKNYVRFAGLILVVLVINLAIYYRSKFVPNLDYRSIDIDVSKDIIDIDFSKLISSTPRPIQVVNKPSVFCIIKTHPDNIIINKTLTVLNVWGQKCDNYR